jgi:hypothetical protein
MSSMKRLRPTGRSGSANPLQPLALTLPLPTAQHGPRRFAMRGVKNYPIGPHDPRLSDINASPAEDRS